MKFLSIALVNWVNSSQALVNWAHKKQTLVPLVARVAKRNKILVSRMKIKTLVSRNVTLVTMLSTVK